MTQSDAALVKRAQGGDRSALEELVRRTSRLVYARLFLETGNRDRAEDLLQDVWLLAHRSLRQLADAEQFRAWLLKIAQNLLIDEARRRARQKRAAPPRTDAESLALLPGTEPLPDDEAAQSELRDQVLAVLRSLPEEYRVPLTLRYLAGADYETIEIQLGLTNGALRGLLHRGLKMLRARLEK